MDLLAGVADVDRLLGALDVVDDPLARRFAAARMLEVEIDDDVEASRVHADDRRAAAGALFVRREGAANHRGVQSGETVRTRAEQFADGLLGDGGLERLGAPHVVGSRRVGGAGRFVPGGLGRLLGRLLEQGDRVGARGRKAARKRWIELDRRVELVNASG